MTDASLLKRAVGLRAAALVDSGMRLGLGTGSTVAYLLVALAITPLRRLLHWRWAAPLRRTFGLAAFGYSCLHYLTYLWLEKKTARGFVLSVM